MKKRVSIEKAKWSNSREEQYKKDCLDIIAGFGDTMGIKECTALIIKNGEQIEISKPDKPKTFWYETWLEVKDYYGINKI